MSYSYFTVQVSKSDTLGGVTGKVECLDISITETDQINLTNQYPMTDEVALSSVTPATITVTNNCTNNSTPVNYTLALTSLKENTGG